MQHRFLALCTLALLAIIFTASAGDPADRVRPVPIDARESYGRSTWGSSPSTHWCKPYFFEGLGDLPGEYDESLANDISADGLRVIGGSSADDPRVNNDGDSATWAHAYQAFGWTRPCEGRRFWQTTGSGDSAARTQGRIAATGGRGPGIFGLGYPLDATHVESLAIGISPDGRTIAGLANEGPDNVHRPGVWSADGFEPLEFLAGHVSGDAWDVSDRSAPAIGGARVTVGFSHALPAHAQLQPGARPVFWLAGDATAHALALPDGADTEDGEATGVANHGLVIAGNLYNFASGPPTASRAVVWVFDSAQGTFGAQLLADLPGGADDAHAYGISGTGEIIVGTGTTEDGVFPCYWRRGLDAFGPAQALPVLDGSVAGYALGADADGSVIGGSCFVGDEARAVLWVDLGEPQVVTGPSGWHLDWVSDLSADGKTFIGQGWRQDPGDPQIEYYEGWIARVP